MNVKSIILTTSLLFFAQGCSIKVNEPSTNQTIYAENEIIEISLTYASLRKVDAQELAQVLRNKGYLVNLRASTTPSKISYSSMYIDKADHKAGAILSIIVIEQLNEEVTTRFSKNETSTQKASIYLRNLQT